MPGLLSGWKQELQIKGSSLQACQGIVTTYERVVKMNEKKTILIVEDDKYIVNFMSMTLKDEGYGYYVAKSVKEAISLFYANQPDMILLDEPFSALDVFLKDRLQQEMIEILADYEGTVILVSHSRDEIYRFSEELLIMDSGQVICCGNTKEIFANPQWKEAARLTGCKNITQVTHLGTNTLMAPDWGVALELHREVPADIRYIGIRAHDFIPRWGDTAENCLPVKVNSMAELQFERKYFLKGAKDCAEEVCWFVQRNDWNMLDEKGIPDYLQVPEDKILLLK